MDGLWDDFLNTIYRAATGKPAPQEMAQAEADAARQMRKAGGSEKDVADTIAQMRKTVADSGSNAAWPVLAVVAVGVLTVLVLSRRP